MAGKLSRLVLDCRGGRNGTDPEISLAGSNQCFEALNVDWYDGLIARKRNGSTALSMTGGTAITRIKWIGRWVPGALETAAELWLLDGAARFKRLAGGTTWADVSEVDTNQHSVMMRAVGFNGKFYLAYNTNVDRLHVYDPNMSSPTIRRVGLATPSAPTIADQGANTGYAAVIRHYRQRTLVIHGSIIDARSEPSTSAPFTPDGAHTSARVTYVSTGVEAAATHWEIEASADNTTFYRLARQTIASNTYDDTLAPSVYDDGAYTVSADAGDYTAPPSVQFLLTDNNRLLMAGGYETGAKFSRVYFTPVLGTTDEGDSERIPNTTTQKNWIDLNENDGGAITGIGGPLNGTIIVWKQRQTWRLIPTGDVNKPYLARKISDSVGCIPFAWDIGLDEAGQPALYWLDQNTPGPWRLGRNGLQYLGRDNEDIWGTSNLSSSFGNYYVLAYPAKHQVWIGVSTAASAQPDTRMVFDWIQGRVDSLNRVRGGWAKHTTFSEGADSGGSGTTLFANTVASSMSSDLKPYYAPNSTVIYKADSSATSEAGVAFQSYVKFPLSTPLGKNFDIQQPHLIAKAASGVTLTLTIDRDFGLQTQAEGTALLTAAASETHVIKQFEGSQLNNIGFAMLQLGDAAAVSNAWTVDGLVVPVTVHEDR